MNYSRIGTKKSQFNVDKQSGGGSFMGIGGSSSTNNEDTLLSAAVDKAVSQMVTKLAELSKKLG